MLVQIRYYFYQPTFSVSDLPLEVTTTNGSGLDEVAQEDDNLTLSCSVIRGNPLVTLVNFSCAGLSHAEQDNVTQTEVHINFTTYPSMPEDSHKNYVCTSTNGEKWKVMDVVPTLEIGKDRSYCLTKSWKRKRFNKTKRYLYWTIILPFIFLLIHTSGCRNKC